MRSCAYCRSQDSTDSMNCRNCGACLWLGVSSRGMGQFSPGRFVVPNAVLVRVLENQAKLFSALQDSAASLLSPMRADPPPVEQTLRYLTERGVQ